ncbi:MAG: OmpH family outer membrane protein [Bacteroidota bacterium]
MKNTFLSLIVLTLAGAMAFGQTQKIAYVNSSKILDELPEARDAAKRLETYAKPIQDSLQMMQKEIQDKYDDYQKKQAIMTEASKASAQQEIQELQQRARDYAQGKDQELARQREKVFTPVKDKILKAIEKIAKAERYSFVLDQNDQVNIVLYADPKDDLTNRVLDNLKRGK